MDQMKIGGFIALCRKEKGWTQSQLAEILGITDKAVSKWETGKSLPDYALLTPLSEALGITLSELFSGERIRAEDLMEKTDQVLLEVIAGWLGRDEQAPTDKSSLSCPVLRLKHVAKVYENDGVLTAQSASKAARFIRLCDCYSLPVVSLINSKGVAVPAVDEQAATIKATTQLLYAYAEATTAKVSIVTGNAIGQAYVAMGGNADVTYAWPGAVISALTPEAAVQVLYTDDLKADKKPALQSRAELEAKFAADVADGVAAAAAGMVDDVIDPAETRKYVIAALEMLSSKRESNPPKKHGNLPL